MIREFDPKKKRKKQGENMYVDKMPEEGDNTGSQGKNSRGLPVYLKPRHTDRSPFLFIVFLTFCLIRKKVNFNLVSLTQ